MVVALRLAALLIPTRAHLLDACDCNKVAKTKGEIS